MQRPTHLFVGDSITDCGRRDDADGLGDGYVRMVARDLAGAGAQVVNRGVGGDRARDLRARWRADVAVHAPTTLTVLVGVNDTWRRYDRDDPTTTASFESDYRAVLASVGPEVRLVLMEPFLVPVTPEQARWREDLDPKIAVVQALAAEHGARLVPLDGLMTEAAERHGAAATAADGVHPTPLGHRLVADAWLEHGGVLA
ncbi:SGNH/GDSL hydrolase family protein [Cellulomonas sp. PhB143]|uniref:SGNH/GDSL hydrolase family protein n=1 Tax=Cellulomonas sp. PhB143 TaxID=2485186 RepID=UPI000FADE2D2|nr:SGNH/GDSL hydrolase family protein [Cellulomonas sp. PhB143]ROS76646.1 lysophospholipase L1-like esterase [Cellulomonas sp. PhB143]